MALVENVFIEHGLPSGVIRQLTDAEMAEYRRPFLEPGEGRRPTLTWPREIPFDGEPSDVDVENRKYLVEDARRAVHELGHDGIDVFCVGLDSGGTSYLARIFGRRNTIQVDRITALPKKLPALYFRLTA